MFLRIYFGILLVCVVCEVYVRVRVCVYVRLYMYMQYPCVFAISGPFAEPRAS